VHERTILLTLLTEDVPYVERGRALTVKALDQGFCRVVARYGFMEIPNVPAPDREDPVGGSRSTLARSATSSAASS
jgi:K+ transporter